MTTEELKKENERLKEVITKKTDIVSILIHQVKTSLSGLKWIIKMFLDGDLGKLTPEQENLLKKGYETNERAINNLNELLLANKTEDIIEKTYNFEEVDLLELTENTVFDFSGEAHMKNIEIIFLKPQQKIRYAKVDNEKMRVVLQNLIENAIKYSDPNGKVFITIKEEGEFLQMSVKDTGTGISEDGKDKIFQKFYRDTEAQKREVTGTGVGLYTVKQIIEKMGGEIWFESTQKQGTTFFFTVPIYK